MTAFDYKNKYRALYLPKDTPAIVEVPPMKYAAVRGHGNPNEESGEYGMAVAVLYGISYTIKMSYRGGRTIDGFFEYVVPPLEGFWWLEGGLPGIDYGNKSGFHWIAVIRVPDFVTEEVFSWAKEEAQRKKGIDMGSVQHCAINSEYSTRYLRQEHAHEANRRSTTPSLRGRTPDADIRHSIHHQLRNAVRAELITVSEGQCVQCLHIGSFRKSA